MLVAKIPKVPKLLEGKSSIQSVFYAHDFYTEYFVDGKSYFSENSNDGGINSPSYAMAETFTKIGKNIVYSKPYVKMMFYEEGNDFIYQPTESELGTLIIYDLEKKEIIFNKTGFTFLNYTDKGYLILKTSLEMKDGKFTGNLIYHYYTIDKSGNFLLNEVSYEEFKKNSATMLSLLPDGSADVNYENYYMGNTLTYALNGKIGVFGEHNRVDRAPTMKWRLNSYQGEVIVLDNKVLSNDTVSYSGNKPFCNKAMMSDYRTFYVKGNKKKMMDGLSNQELDLSYPIVFNLTDTNYVLESVEFKDKLVIQNISGEVRAHIKYDYDPNTDEISYILNDSGDTVVYVNVDARSGIYDFSISKWLVPAKYFRVIPADKYFIASYFHFQKEVGMVKSEFKRDVSNMKFDVYDKKGKLVLTGNAAEVKKKAGVDVKTLQYEY